MATSLEEGDAIAFTAGKSSDIRRRRIRRMTYAWQKQVLEEECGQVGAPAEPGFPVDRERLLADCPFAGFSQLRDFLMTQALELEQRDVAFRRRQGPFVKLGVDGRAEALEHVSRFAAPALRLGAGLDELAV